MKFVNLAPHFKMLLGTKLKGFHIF